LNALLSIDNFFDLNQKDIYGKTPLDYALLQESGKMVKILQSKLGESIDEKDVIRGSYLKESDWPPKLYDFD
jgi:ankyrin repeat protein